MPLGSWAQAPLRPRRSLGLHHGAELAALKAGQGFLGFLTAASSCHSPHLTREQSAGGALQATVDERCLRSISTLGPVAILPCPRAQR